MEMFHNFCRNDTPKLTANSTLSIQEKFSEESQDLVNKWKKLISVNSSRIKFRKPILKKNGRQSTIRKFFKSETIKDSNSDTSGLPSTVQFDIKEPVTNFKRVPSEPIVEEPEEDFNTFNTNFNNIKLIDDDSETENLNSFQDFETKSYYNFDEICEDYQVDIPNESNHNIGVQKLDVKRHRNKLKSPSVTNCFPS